MLGGVGAMSLKGGTVSRYASLFIGLSFMLLVTMLVLRKERKTRNANGAAHR